MLVMQHKQGKNPVSPFTDNFNDNYLDLFYWTTVGDLTNNSVAEQNQRLEVTRGTTGGAWSAGGTAWNYGAVGDFDFQIDLDTTNVTVTTDAVLLQTYMEVVIGSYPYAVISQHRTTDGFSGYTTDPANTGTWPTTLITGSHSNTPSLRITRVGTTLTGYRNIGGGWISYLTATVPTTAARPQILVNSQSAPATPQLAIFDNFSITADSFEAL